MSTKPEWFSAHEESDRENFKEILDRLKALDDKITPVMDTYRIATTLGKWSKGLLGFILLIVTLWAAVKNADFLHSVGIIK